MTDPWKVFADLSNVKARLVTRENAKEYLPYLTNKAFSYFMDTVLLANEMNMAAHLDNLIQHDFYFHSVKRKKRFSKWAKADVMPEHEAVAAYFGYSLAKAEKALPLLKPEELEVIMRYAENLKEINIP